MDRKTGQKINNDIEDLNKTVSQLDLTYLQETSSKVQNTHSSAHWIVSRLDHMIGYKASFNIFYAIEIVKKYIILFQWDKESGYDPDHKNLACAFKY